MDLRCFIAIELPEGLKKEIGACIDRLKQTKADVKWARSENLHLTLKFLGKTQEELLAQINERLRSIGKLHNKFSLNVFGSGIFPNIKHPRVIWIGMHDSEAIVSLQKDIDKSMAELGYEKEGKKFSPHLTIGRVRSSKNADMLIKELATLKEVDFGMIEVRRIALMESKLKPAGAEYSRLEEIPVGAG